MPFNKRSFFLAATAIELALLLGYGRSQYTGNLTNVINTKMSSSSVSSRIPFLVPPIAGHPPFRLLCYLHALWSHMPPALPGIVVGVVGVGVGE